MAEPFAINIADQAADHLDRLQRYAQRVVLDGIELHLRHLPMEETRRIKQLRLNFVAGWELRLGDYRVTQEGHPIFELLPIRPDDSGLLEHLIEHDSSFRSIVEQAREDVREGRVSSIEAVRATSRHPRTT